MPVTERVKKEDNYIPEPQWDTIFGCIEKNDQNDENWEEQGDVWIPIVYCVTMEVADQHGEIYVKRKWVTPPLPEEVDPNFDMDAWWDFVLTDIYSSLREIFA